MPGENCAYTATWYRPPDRRRPAPPAPSRRRACRSASRGQRDASPRRPPAGRSRGSLSRPFTNCARAGPARILAGAGRSTRVMAARWRPRPSDPRAARRRRSPRAGHVGDDRRATRHRFERQGRSLVKRRKHEHRDQAIDRRQRLVREEAEEPHVLVQVVAVHRPSQRGASSKLVADDDRRSPSRPPAAE